MIPHALVAGVLEMMSRQVGGNEMLELACNTERHAVLHMQHAAWLLCKTAYSLRCCKNTMQHERQK